MTIKKLLLCATMTMALGACSSVGSLFEGDKPAPLEGERISVLELQKTLAPDASTAAQKITLPAVWTNKAWPQAGGYPTHTMQNLAFDAANLDLVWKTSIGDGSTKRLPLTARPIIVGNAVFTLDTSAELSAFDTEKGNRVWRTNIRKEKEKEDVIAGGISYADGMIFATNGYDEALAVNAQNGEIIWRKRLPSPSRAAPTVLNGRIFVTTLDNRLMAFDAKNGESLWEYTGVGEAAGLLGAASPAADEIAVVPVFSSGEITALRIENGSVAWSDNLASVRNYGGGLESLSDIKAMPVLSRGLVLAISFSGRMAAIEQATGQRVWQREISGSETPWVAGDYVFVISTDGQLAALNLADGAILWVNDLPRYDDQEKKETLIQWMGPVMASGTLILAGSNGDIVTVNSLDGKIINHMKTKQKLTMPPIISGGMLYLLADNGTMLAYR